MRRALVGRDRAAGGLLRRAAGRLAIVATHKARSPVVAADSVAYQRVTLRTADGLRARRLVRAVAQWRRGDRLPRALGPCGTPGCCPARLRRPAPRPARRGRERGRAEPLRLERRADDLRPRSASSPAAGRGAGADRRARAVGRRRTAACRPPRTTVGCGPSSPRAPACARLPSTPHARVGRVQRWGTTGSSRRPPWPCSRTRRRPPDLAGLAGRIAPRPVLLIRAADGHTDEVLNRVYLDRARDPKALWTLGRGGHTGALAATRQAYERRVGGFFDRALLR